MCHDYLITHNILPFKHENRVKCTKEAGKNFTSSPLHLVIAKLHSVSSKTTTTYAMHYLCVPYLLNPYLWLSTGKAVKHRHKVDILSSKSRCKFLPKVPGMMINFQ